MRGHTGDLTRRSFLAGVGTIAGVATAGCAQVLGDEPITFEAAPATVPESTLAETGYEKQDLEEVVEERTVEAAGQSRDVVVRNWQAEYDKAVDLGVGDLPIEGQSRAAIFTVLTTPQVEVLGRSFNPVADMDADELAEMVQDQYEGIDDVERVDEESVTIAGESTTVGIYEAAADLFEAGVTVDITLHVTEAVEAGEDLIVAIGGYPGALREQEEEHVETMMEAIEYEG